MIIKKILIFLFLICTTFNTFAEAEKESYDAMCLLVQDSLAQNLEPTARLTYINKHFDARVGADDIKEAFDLIFQVEPNKRYLVFKHAVENSLGQPWDCTALSDFFE